MFERNGLYDEEHRMQPICLCNIQRRMICNLEVLR